MKGDYDNLVFTFGKDYGESNDADKNVLGGKGASLMEMSNMGLPVPPGITISTEACRMYMNGELDMGRLMDKVTHQLDRMQKLYGYMPLVAVRSGAPVSMPGMMDTILNVGLYDESLRQWEKNIGVWAARDSYRRLYWMFGETVLGIPARKFRAPWDKLKKNKYELPKPPTSDANVSIKHLDRAVEEFKKVYAQTGYELPQSFTGQVRASIIAVFKSWMNDRAVAYRNEYGLDHDIGTAVNIVAMVFGNMNHKSCSGVLFTRDPSTGDPELVGEYLPKAQGEDVVSGIRTPYPISKMVDWNDKVVAELKDMSYKLEMYYRDVQDVEFTVQDGSLYLLQTRAAKRSAKAAFKIAVDLVDEGVVSKEDAVKLIDKRHMKVLTETMVDDEACERDPDAIGAPAAGSVVHATVVTSKKKMESMRSTGLPYIFVAEDTNPDDFVAMQGSVGVLTKTGGITSHAAVVARSMNKSCVVGCDGLTFDKDGEAWLGELPLTDGAQPISIDGATGRVWVGYEPPLLSMKQDPNVEKVLSWLDEVSDLVALYDFGLDEELPKNQTEVRITTLNMADHFLTVKKKIQAMLKQLSNLNPNLSVIYLDLRRKEDLLSEHEKKMADLTGQLNYLMVDSLPPYRTARYLLDGILVHGMYAGKHGKVIVYVICGPEDMNDVNQACIMHNVKILRKSSTVDELLSDLPDFNPDEAAFENATTEERTRYKKLRESLRPEILAKDGQEEKRVCKPHRRLFDIAANAK